MRIVFTGGGSGGHFFPIIAVAREVKRIAEEERILDVRLFYFAPEPFAPDILEREEIVFSRIRAGKIRRYFSLQNFTDVITTAVGILEALWKMFVVMPDVIFAKGGYGSFPALVAARIYAIPIIIHDSDAVPGQVNRWAGRWARRVAISFAGAGKYFPEGRTALTGVPIRKRISGGNADQAREIFGVFSSRPVIFITGGSQGAGVINDTTIQILKELIGRYEIIHQVGVKNFDEVRLETAPILEGGGEAYYHPVSFLDEARMRSAYLLADLIISRAGATAIAEVAAEGKPAILIPIKNSAQDHQRENAYEYSQRGGAVVIEENNLTPSVLLNEITKLLSNPEILKKLGEAAGRSAMPDAAETIAREIIRLGLH